MKSSLKICCFSIYLFIIIVSCNGTKSTKTNRTTTELILKHYPKYDKTLHWTNYLSVVGRWLQSFTTESSSRTFGAMRRIQHTFIALFFKLGVIVTILVFLTVMVVKGLMMGAILLFFNFSGFLAKVYSVKSEHSYTPHYAQAVPAIKNIHVHVHPPPKHHSEILEEYPHHYGSGNYHYFQHKNDDLNTNGLLNQYSNLNYYPSSDSMLSATGSNQVNSLTLEERDYINRLISKLN